MSKIDFALVLVASAGWGLAVAFIIQTIALKVQLRFYNR